MVLDELLRSNYFYYDTLSNSPPLPLSMLSVLLNCHFIEPSDLGGCLYLMLN